MQDKPDIKLTNEEQNAIDGLKEIAFYMETNYYDWNNKYGVMNSGTIAFARKAIIDNAKRRQEGIDGNGV